MTHRRGLALPAAIFVLALVALTIAGSAFATSQESRASVGVLAQRLALEAAEYGAAAVLRDWDASWNLGMPIGSARSFSHVMAGANADTRLTRTSTTTWWVVSTGSAGGPAASRQAGRTINALIRLDLAADDIVAAVGATDSVRVVGSGMVVGVDSVESSAACASMAAPVAGVAAPDTTRICDGVCGASSGGIVGVPRLVADPGIAARVAAAYASSVPDVVLPAGAVVTPGPVVVGGTCDTLALTNWGDPAGGVCGTHLPVIRALGDLTIDGGVGHGVILVDGDVTLRGGARFAGLVVSRDDLRFAAGGGTILGAVLAGDERRGPGDHTVIGDGGMVRRSSCRIRQARLASATPVRIRERWWAEYE